MSSGNQSNRPTSVPIGQTLLMVLPIAVGMVAGKLTGEAVEESIGWWGALGVGSLAASIVALIVVFVIQMFQRKK